LIAVRFRIAALAVGALALTAAAYQKEIVALVDARSADGRAISGFARLDSQSLRDPGTGRQHAGGATLVLQVPGVTGPATFDGKNGYIAVDGYSIGADGGRAANGAPKKPELGALQISKAVDATSPVFSNHYFTGEPFKGVTTLEFAAPNSKAPEQVIELTNATVVSDAIDGSSGGTSEQLTFAYAGIKFCTAAVQSSTLTCTQYNFTAPPTPPPPTATPSASPSATPTPAVTPSPTPRPTPTPVVTASPTPTPTPTASPSPIAISEFSTGLSPGAVPALIRVAHGQMWFAENGTSQIATISTSGVIHEYTTTTGGSGPVEVVEAPAAAFGAVNNMFTENATNKIGVMDTSGNMINEYTIPTESSEPFGLTTDSSGSDLWFTQNSSGQIGKMTTGGAVSEFDTDSEPVSITENVSNLKLYFTEPGYIGVVNSPTSEPVLHEYALPGSGSPWGIAQGSDGQMWFTDQGTDAIGSFNTSTNAIAEYSTGITQGDTYPRDIASGPDGALWFTEWGANKIGRIDPTTHAITEYPVSNVDNPNPRPYGIVKDPTGAAYMWFTESTGNKIGRIGPIPNSGASSGIRRRGSLRAHATGSVHPNKP
jgi:virginiamycin B lyase